MRIEKKKQKNRKGELARTRFTPSCIFWILNPDS